MMNTVTRGCYGGVLRPSLCISLWQLQVRVGEEGGIVPLVVERAQGTLGAVSVEWRTIDRTAVSEGKSPPDYVVGTLPFVMLLLKQKS